MQTCTHLVTGDLLILSGSSVTLKKKTKAHVSNRWVHMGPRMLMLTRPTSWNCIARYTGHSTNNTEHSSLPCLGTTHTH